MDLKLLRTRLGRLTPPLRFSCRRGHSAESPLTYSAGHSRLCRRGHSAVHRQPLPCRPRGLRRDVRLAVTYPTSVGRKAVGDGVRIGWR